MTSSRTPRPALRRLSSAALLVVLAVIPVTVGPQMKVWALGQADDSAVSSKLTTALADLARSIPQRSHAAADRTGRVTPLSLDAMPKSARDARVARLMRIDENNAVQVYVHVQEVNADNLQALTAAGVTIEIADAPTRRVQAHVPVSQLHAVAALPFVNFVGLPRYARFRTGSTLTEGDAILHSNGARSQSGLDGTGIKVGVISDGIRGVFATGCQTCSGATNGPIASGDLPSATGTRQPTGIGTYGILLSASGGITGQSFVLTGDATYGPAKGDLEGALKSCSFAGAGAEGTALLEIVHDVAPNAQLSFANFDTDLAFNQAVNTLAASNDVVIDDIGFYGYPSDGTSSVSANTAAALNNPSNRIRAYITAGGNAADEHYIGTYLQSSVAPSTLGITAGGHLHQFQQGADTTDVLNLGPKPYNLIKLPNNAVVVIFLTWNDPWGASANNYDLYLVDVTKGTVVQKGSPGTTPNDPEEELAYQNTTGAAQTLGIVVQNVNDAAAPKDLNIFSYGPECYNGPALLANGRHERHNYNTATRSISAQNDAGGSPVSVLSVAAICSASAKAQAAFSGSAAPDESCFDATNSTAEFFSSRGPTLDGRTKPDITGIDGVSVTGAASFPNPFFGTSAAAPHVAGIAALALQAAPCLVSGGNGALDSASARGKLRNLLTGNAAGLGDPNTFGSGRADALATVQGALPSFTGSSTLTVPGTSAAGAAITAAQLGFSDPNQCPLGNMKWTGGCGTSPGSAMTCPLGTTNVSVSATNNGVAFSSPVNVQVNVTSFALAAAPATSTVAPGQSATYQVTVSSQSGPFPSNVTLGCANLPPNATCSFEPATVTPGATSAQSTLTISTTAPALAGIVGANPAKAGSHASAFVPAKAGSHASGFVPAKAGSHASGFVPAKAGSHASGFGHASGFVDASGFANTSAPRTWDPPSGGFIALSFLVFVAAIVIAVPAPRRRRLAPMAATATAVAFLAVQLACGSNTPKTPPPPTPAPAVTLSSASVSFATQYVKATSPAQTITLTNSGNATLTIASITASGDFAQTNNCGGSVAAGANCAISVTFTPTAAGQRTGAVTITDNAANSPHSAALSGTGQAANGTPAGTYQVSVTGTAGALVQSGGVSLVVR